jgi:hypothetical protein
MIKDTFKTDVIFRKEKENSILAIFPYILWNLSGDVACYAHIGQHGSADYNYCIQKSKLAKPEEYKDLFTELESLGYNLNIIKKRNRTKFAKSIL